MADIQSEVLKKYEIDIEKEDIFKLYQIKEDEILTISEQDLQRKITETRERWKRSINGSNEKIAERDRLRLEKADKYEAILKDVKLRKKIFACRNKIDSHEDTLMFAREYFKLLSTTGRIKEEHFEFYFEYFDGETKNRKAIKEMLEKEFKFRSSKANEDTETNENGKEESETKNTSESDFIIKNRFAKDTIIKLKKCINFFEAAKQNMDVCRKYPALRENLSELIEMSKMKEFDQFQKSIEEKRRIAYTERQESGIQYMPIVDLFNTLDKLVKENGDVRDNFSEFKLLIKYPILSPYMYALEEMKLKTFKELLKIAKKEYFFRDDADFLLNYYIPLHEHFGITNSGIESLIRKAEKKTKANKVFNGVAEKLHIKRNRNISLGEKAIYWGLYFPIFTVYFVFEVIKVVFTQIHKFVIPLFTLLFIVSNVVFPKMFEVENLLVIGKIFSDTEWRNILSEFYFFDVNIVNKGIEMTLVSVVFIIWHLLIYVLPALFISVFLKNAATDLNKRYDWIGSERTFKNILLKLKMKTEEQYRKQRNLFYKKNVPKVVLNIFCLIATILLTYTFFVGF